MKAITLINPKGERKDLTNVEFFDLQTQFAKSKAFARWSETRKTGRAELAFDVDNIKIRCRTCHQIHDHTNLQTKRRIMSNRIGIIRKFRIA